MINNTEKGVILVVDDEKDVTMSLKGFFAAMGYDMLTALDGTEALKTIDALTNLDLILLDVRMPGVDGIQILKHLRKTKPKTKVIIMTAYDKEVLGDAENIGVDGFFPKPIDLSRLLDRVGYLLKKPATDTRVYPSKEKPEETKKAPQAKLLFLEPNPVVFGFTCGYFAETGLIIGDYTIMVEYAANTSLEPLYNFEPDVVIMYDNLFGMVDTEAFAELMMHSSHKPKTVILHGIFPKTELEVRALERKGLRYCNQNTMNDHVFRASNKKLADFVAKECIKRGLVKKA